MGGVSFSGTTVLASMAGAVSSAGCGTFEAEADVVSGARVFSMFGVFCPALCDVSEKVGGCSPVRLVRKNTAATAESKPRAASVAGHRLRRRAGEEGSATALLTMLCVTASSGAAPLNIAVNCAQLAKRSSGSMAKPVASAATESLGRPSTSSEANFGVIVALSTSNLSFVVAS